MKLVPALVFASCLLEAGAALAQQPREPYRNPPPFFGGQDKRDKDEEGKVRSVQGLVTLPNEQPAEGAVVQLKDTKTLQVRSFITKEDGTYHFHGLNTNVDYQIKADREGASSAVKTISVFDSRKLVTVNLKLEPKK